MENKMSDKKKILYVSNIPTPLLKFLRARTDSEYDDAYYVEEVEEMLESKDYDGVFLGSLRIPSWKAANDGEDRYCGGGVKIARDVKEKGLPVLVLSGTSDGEVLKQLRECNVDRIEHKPTSIKVLTDAISEVFG